MNLCIAILILCFIADMGFSASVGFKTDCSDGKNEPR